MDAVDYIKNHEKMCGSCDECKGCPIREACGPEECYHWAVLNAEEAVRIVEEWVEDQKMTNARKFKEVFGFEPAILFYNEWEMPVTLHPFLTNQAFWKAIYQEPQHDD